MVVNQVVEPPSSTNDAEQPFLLAGHETTPENVVRDKLAPYLHGVCADIGCGVGRNVRLMPAGSIALDYVPANLRSIPDEYRRVQADANRPLPLPDETFDVVFCGHLVEHVYSPTLMLRELHRILKPDGLLILGVPNPSCAWMDYYSLSRESDWSEHLTAWDWKQIRRFVTLSGFRVEKQFANYPNLLKFVGKRLSSTRLLLRFGSDIWTVALKSEGQIHTPTPARLKIYRFLKRLALVHRIWNRALHA